MQVLVQVLTFRLWLFVLHGKCYQLEYTSTRTRDDFQVTYSKLHVLHFYSSIVPGTNSSSRQFGTYTLLLVRGTLQRGAWYRSIEQFSFRIQTRFFV